MKTITETPTKMKTTETKTTKMKKKTLSERECTYPPTSTPFIMTWIHTLFANNQMRIFMERSMQTMDQHIKCNNITTNEKFYKLDTTTFACIIVIHTSETFKGF
ncbi:uncharacterized protein LOC124419032 [Lucilia cuprina]|uniref:uncharacterized protein LOC124419032 n=1 Tax=Lucilia cuprina TaxID=7375 RepID=UPI001F054AD6|nr:uncharacterized protein LOC124419032 [Lucilia cuprina]